MAALTHVVRPFTLSFMLHNIQSHRSIYMYEYVRSVCSSILTNVNKRSPLPLSLSLSFGLSPLRRERGPREREGWC